MWPQCFKYGVAAITYGPIRKTNLSKYKEGAPKELWAKLEPTQKASLKRVAYEMKKGDTIYTKEGKNIIGKGRVIGPYKYDRHNRIIDPYGSPWNQQVPVKWQTDFQPVQLLLGAEQLTVKSLTRKDVQALERQIVRNREDTHHIEAMEAQLSKAEVVFRKRNRTIIAAKKALSDGTCEACGMKFIDKYDITELCLVAHHKKPIGLRKRASITTLDDIALLCPNCHAVAHIGEPPLPIAAIRKMLR